MPDLRKLAVRTQNQLILVLMPKSGLYFWCENTTTDKTPFRYKPYKASGSERAFVRDEMKLLKYAGITIDTESDYASLF